ncbi:MAG: site-specific DNA-methyltransferase [Pseudomonadota bacterium]
MTHRIIQGHTLNVLRRLPDGSVNCIVTSPPYWGLRDYKTAPIVWDGSVECKHAWSDASTFCSRCNAWRGSLGGEPIPELYVQHLAAIFREVYRVLRSDGTLWLNLGDCYAANRSYQVGSTKGGAKHSPAQEHEGSRVPDGLKPKDLIGIPWRVAFALQAGGWFLRSDVIWAKGTSGQGDNTKRLEEACAEVGLDAAMAQRLIETFDPYVGNCMPEAVRDRPTKSHEYLFLLTKQKSYYYDKNVVAEEAVTCAPVVPWTARKCDQSYLPTDMQQGIGGHGFPAKERPIGVAGYSAGNKRNLRSVWTIPTKPFRGAHFAVMAPKLAETCIKAGCPAHGVVLDPFSGAATTGVAAIKLGRSYVGIELNHEYVKLSERRLVEEETKHA